MNLIRTLIYSCFVFAFFSACTSESSQQNITKQNSEPSITIPEPFHYHKAVEVKPGLTFDVVSWGRGSELISAFLILRSDSTKLKYRSTSGELEGRIIDAWNMDMDSDGNPEIFIQAQGEEKDSFLKMYVYEFNDSGSSQEIRFPELSRSSKKGYLGKDSLYVIDGKIRRQFPVYDESDTAGVNPIGKKVLEYHLRGNSFNVDEVEVEDK